MRIFFTSDTHYNHNNIAGPSVSRWSNGYRNFNSVWEMNKTLVETINKYVAEDDILYHLGDWSFGGVHNIYHFRKMIVCKNIHLILGNHDQHIRYKEIKIGEDFFNPIKLFTSVNNVMEISHGKNKFFLSHYPHLSWNGSSRGVTMLHGHEHGNFDHLNTNTKRMDVGVDTAYKLFGEYRPFSIEEVIGLNESKDLKILRHH